MQLRQKGRLVGYAVITVAAALGGLALIQALRSPIEVRAQSTPPLVVDVPLGSLKSVPTPKPPRNLANFIKADGQDELLALGKALFWDQAVGSDGCSGREPDGIDCKDSSSSKPIGQACASCHFNAGADSRTRNQLNPGFRAIPQDFTFQGRPTSTGYGVGYRLRLGDFPFHVPGGFDTNDSVSSQGVIRHHFLDILPGKVNDLGSAEGSIFRDHVPFEREVEPRNTPTTINAVFNFRNFWDGRARNEFNGVNPIGDLDPFARVLLSCVDSSGKWLTGSSDPLGRCDGSDALEKVRLIGNLRLENSSLASQADGPPLSDLEMSYNGRSFPKLGKKMLALARALPNQLVDPNDSVLGPYSAGAGTPGLTTDYTKLIKAAFVDRWWNSKQCVKFENDEEDETTQLDFGACVSPATNTSEFTQMEFNFSLFWGLAIQAYEQTLRADDSRFDRFFDGNSSALTSQEKLGLNLFSGKGKCIACHGGPETTNASVQNVANEKLERMIMGDDNIAVYDNGFYNTAVTICRGNVGGAPPTSACSDIGIGATIGPLNLPLSMSRFFQLKDQCNFGSTTIGGIKYSGCLGAPLIAPRPAEGIPFNLLQPAERVAADGAFKTPGLRNVELTAPYFHNGGSSTLKQVIDFYNRGGNFPQENEAHFDPNIVPLGLTSTEVDALVALMKAMTDERVRCQQAPFDHPQLFVPDLPVDGSAVPTSFVSNGKQVGILKQVGKSSSCTPFRTFVQNLAP